MGMSGWMAKIPQSEVKSRYGLEAHEWAGSLSDRVMWIMNTWFIVMGNRYSVLV